MVTRSAQASFDFPIEQTNLADERSRARQLGKSAAVDAVGSYVSSEEAASGRIAVVDLFCGAGGLSVGFETVGRLVDSYRLVRAVDNDEKCIATYGANLPTIPIQRDLGLVSEDPDARRELFGPWGSSERGDNPLVVVGGPPCQGFSAHRKSEGHSGDTRNSLVAGFAKIAVELTPEFIVLENVPELLADKHWEHFMRARRVFEDAGYRVRAQIHNLAGYGVPQERFRALVVAAREPFMMPRPFLEPEEYRTVRDAIGHLPEVDPGVPADDDPMHVSSRHRSSTIETIKQIPKDGGNRPDGVGPDCLDRVDGYRDVYGRLYWDRPSNTITAYARNPASGRYIHPEQNRGLTVREAALLQGFPRRFEFKGGHDHRFRQIGNAVPPPFAAYVASHIFGELEAPDRGELDDPSSHLDVTSPRSNSFSSGIAGRKKRSG